MKTDYPELEGKVIKYKVDDISMEARVIGCNYHIGLTILGKDGFKCCCLNKKKHFSYGYTRYRKAFYDLIKAIKSGTVEVGVNVQNIDPRPNGVMASCAFGE